MREHPVGRARAVLRAAGVAGVGAAALLAGCGGSSSSVAPPPAKAASATTGAAGTAAASGNTATTGGKAAATSLKELSRRSGAATRAAGTVHMSMSSGPTTAAVKPVATAQLRFGAQSTDMALGLLGATAAKVVAVKGTVYFGSGQAIGGKHWIKIDPAGKDRVSRAVAPLLSSMTGNVDTTSQLARMPDAKLASATATTLRGTPVTKYVVTLTEGDLLAGAEAFSLPAEVKKQTAAALKGAHGTTTLYLDEHDLPLQAESVISGMAKGGSVTLVSYSGWGEPVTIAVPPATDVVDPKALGG